MMLVQAADYRAASVATHWAAAGARIDAARSAGVLFHCDAVWPPSTADLRPAGCQLAARHRGPHAHRPNGFQAVVQW